MLEAPVGLALFGSDLRFRWVNAALTRLSESAGTDPSAPSDPHPDPSAWTGLLPSEAWPEHVATRAEAALRKVLDEGVPLAERGYPVMSPPAGGAAPSASAPASAPAEDVCGCASWFPVHDAAGKVFGAGPDHAQRGRAQHRGRRGGRGRDQAQRGAVPLAGPGRRPGGMGGGAGRRDEGRLAGVALDHRAVRAGLHRVRLAGVDPPGGPGAGRAGLARVRPDRQDLRRPVPDPHQGRLVPALRRARGPDRAGRQDRRVGRRQHRRDQPARGRGDARPADRAAVRRGAAHRAAAAGHLDAGRGADGGAGGRGHHRGGPDRDRRAALGGGAAGRRAAARWSTTTCGTRRIRRAAS